MAWRGAVTRTMKGMMEQERMSLKNALFSKGKSKGDYVPVYVALGLISLQAVIGIHIIKQQLMHSPGVRLNKSRRETLPELVEPERVVEESDNFIKKSYFRKLACVQEFETPMPDPIHGNPLAKEPKWESLNSVGVNYVDHTDLHR